MQGVTGTSVRLGSFFVSVHHPVGLSTILKMFIRERCKSRATPVFQSLKCDLPRIRGGNGNILSVSGNSRCAASASALW